MTRPTPPSAANPGPGSAGPPTPAITSADLYEWIARRRRVRRRAAAVAVVLIAVGVAVLAAYWTAFSRHLLAKGRLESHDFVVDWDLNASNLGTGGITSAWYRPEPWRPRQAVQVDVLDSLKALNHLRSLDLSSFDTLRDDELAVVASLTELDDLELNRFAGEPPNDGRLVIPLTDRVLDHIGGLTRLRSLGLSGNRITNSGLAKLANLRDLEVLDLDGTLVTNAGLDALVGLKSLKTLRVENTKVTRKGVARFQQKRPDVEVTLRGNTDEFGAPTP